MVTVTSPIPLITTEGQGAGQGRDGFLPAQALSSHPELSFSSAGFPPSSPQSVKLGQSSLLIID